jgi:DnaK suppressor protein
MSPTEESIVATAAKKPVSKPVASSSKKAAAKPATPAKVIAKASAPQKAAVAVKAAPVKAVAKAAAKAASRTPAPVTTKEKPVAKKAAANPVKAQVAAVSKASAKPVVPKTAPVAKPQPAPEKPVKPMKTAEAKTSTAKPAPKSAAKPAAKAGKKIAGIPHNDAELMAMSESDYMNDAQLAYFKAKLTVMRDEILENARETGEHLKENEVFADPNDRATVEEENLLEQRVRDRERKLLKKITTALARIEAGEYGYCLETGDPIGLPRLLARPTAELSIEAQEKHERLEKLYAD